MKTCCEKCAKYDTNTFPLKKLAFCGQETICPCHSEQVKPGEDTPMTRDEFISARGQAKDVQQALNNAMNQQIDNLKRHSRIEIKPEHLEDIEFDVKVKPQEPYNQVDHSHCWDQKVPACGIKEHLRCCLCERVKPKVCDKYGHGYMVNNGICMCGEKYEAISKPQSEEWELFNKWKQNAKKCFKIYDGKEFCGLCGVYPDDLEMWIKSLIAKLQDEYAELNEKILKEQKARVREKLEGMKVEVKNQLKREREYWTGYNQAIDEAIEEIT